MFGLSFWEIALILAIALIVLGPSKLPELARSLGKGLREFRKATDDFKTTINDELYKPESPRNQELGPLSPAKHPLPEPRPAEGAIPAHAAAGAGPAGAVPPPSEPAKAEPGTPTSDSDKSGPSA